jgi:hypothetical protein
MRARGLILTILASLPLLQTHDSDSVYPCVGTGGIE